MTVGSGFDEYGNFIFNHKDAYGFSLIYSPAPSSRLAQFQDTGTKIIIYPIFPIFSHIFTDNIGELDSKTEIRNLNRTKTELIGSVDTKTRFATKIREKTELLGVKDSKTRLVTRIREKTNIIGISEPTDRTVKYQVNLSSDDCLKYTTPTGYTFSLTERILIGDDSSSYYDFQSGIRFQNIRVPKNAIIISAYLKFYGNTYSEPVPAIPTTYIKGEKSVNPITFSTLVDYNARSRTDAEITWTPSSWLLDAWNTSPDIKTIIQEIVNQDEWILGNSMAFFWKDADGWGGSQKLIAAYAYDYGASKAPKLEITYTAPGINKTKSIYRIKTNIIGPKDTKIRRAVRYRTLLDKVGSTGSKIRSTDRFRSKTELLGISDYSLYSIIPSLCEYYNTGDDGYVDAYDQYWKAQTFTVNSHHTITSVKLKLNRFGYPGTITVSIRATDINGHPTGPDLTVGTTNGNTLPDYYGPTPTPEWREITLTEYSLAESKKYAIVVRIDDHNYHNCVRWWMDSTSPTYTGGCFEQSSNSGNTWTSFAAFDMMFEVWGNTRITFTRLATRFRTYLNKIGLKDTRTKLVRRYRIFLNKVGSIDSKIRNAIRFRTWLDKIAPIDTKIRAAIRFRTFLNKIGPKDIKTRIVSRFRTFIEIAGGIHLLDTLKSRYKIYGQTLDADGTPIGNCTVYCFRTDNNKLVGSTTSDDDGNYELYVISDVDLFVVAFKAGIPNVQGITDNTLRATKE